MRRVAILVLAHRLAPEAADWLRGEAQRLVGEVLGVLPRRPRLFVRTFDRAAAPALAGAVLAGRMP